MFNVKIHYKWAIFNSYVKSPKGNLFMIESKVFRGNYMSDHGLLEIPDLYLIFPVN